jgi:hypothetical protein
MAEIVDSIPFWCEKMQYGPGVIDEGRGESMVHDMKLCSPNSRNMINHLPDMYEELAARRNASRKDKLPVLPHKLDDAMDEILAPCMLQQGTHLGDNWAEFTKRWSPQHAAFWQHHGEAGNKSVKFLVGSNRNRVTVHCKCKAHFVLQFEENWRSGE